MAKRMASLAVVLSLVVVAGAQQPPIQNAKLETRAVTSLARDVAALAAQATDSVWVAWRVPMIDGERSLCCYYSDQFNSPGVRGCTVEPAPTDAIPRVAPAIAAPTGPVPLEAGTGLVIFVRLIDKRIERLRTLGDDCPTDASGRPVYWLQGVSGADSVSYLASLASDTTMALDVRSNIASAAVRAISLHRDPAAVPALIQFARATPETGPNPALTTATRRAAMNGLGQSRDPRAIAFLEGIIK